MEWNRKRMLAEEIRDAEGNLLSVPATPEEFLKLGNTYGFRYSYIGAGAIAHAGEDIDVLAKMHIYGGKDFPMQVVRDLYGPETEKKVHQRSMEIREEALPLEVRNCPRRSTGMVERPIRKTGAGPYAWRYADERLVCNECGCRLENVFSKYFEHP